MAQNLSNPTTNLTKVAGTTVDTNTGNATAGTQRVVLASNQPAIPISDNGGSITVDGTFWQATQPVSLASLPSLPAGTNNIGDVDVLSIIPGTGAANLGKQTDSAAGATDTGVAILGIRDDALTTLTPADGDYTRFRVNSVGRLWTSATIDAALPAGTNAIGSITNTSFASTQSGTWTVQPGNTPNTTPWLVRSSEGLGTATALGALNAEITQALNGNLGSAVTITATATPTGIVLTPYASYDGGTNWTATQFFNSANGDAISTLSSFTVGASYSVSAGDGATHVKVRATSWTSGSVTVRLSSTNSQGLVNLKATAIHDDPAGSFLLQAGAVGSSTAPTAVSANGDAVRLWATTSGALNVADGGSTLSIDDGGGSITVDGTVGVSGSVAVTGTFWQATQPVSLASVPTHAVTQSGNWTVQGVSANGAAVSGNPVLMGGSDGTNARSFKVATDGTLLINGVQDSRSAGFITSVASVVGPISVSNRNVTTISISGTYAGVTFVVEASDDGTGWYPLQCINNATGQAGSTWTPGTNVSASYDTAVGGYISIRVRATAWTSGTAIIGISNQVFAYDPVVAALSQGIAANGTAALGNPVLMAGWNGTNAYTLRTDTSGQLILGAGSNSIGTVELGSTTLTALEQVSNVPPSTVAAANSPSSATTTAYASSIVAKASAGIFYSLTGFNAKTSGQFIQVHNTTAVPADAAVPVLIFYVPASSNFSYDLGMYGRYFSAGITICNSSTGPTKTIGAADCWFDVLYK